jgi:hypothetical protein
MFRPEKDSLISQYQHVTKMNDVKLRAARDIKDLVNIHIEKVPASVRQRDGCYDLKFDPVKFK